MTLSRTNPRATRRWGLLAAIVFTTTLFGGAVTLAVHEAGAFELDAVSADAVDSPAGMPDDWDNICADNSPSDCTFKAGVTASGSNASSSSHENDGNLNATIFTGGGSKDGLPIAGWLWKDGAGGLPDKDNLLHAYAARYTVDSNAGCPGPTGDTTGAEDCSLIYFGSDRYANDGDATQAFWFLQSQVAANGAASKGGNHFTGTHTDGDLLIISEFSNGGTTSTITVYKWTGDDATGGLTFLSGGENKNCDTVAEDDPFCGIVNTNTTPTFSPWAFLDKAGSTNFRQGELFEAGINLSHPDINLDEECFSSFVAETRSSTSVTATLKDFVVGDFESCAGALTTQVEKDNLAFNGTVTPGTPVYDTATVAITGAGSPADATGSVSFYLCGPTTSATACSSATGTLVSTETLIDTSSPANANDGISGADSDAVNISTAPLAPGFWCFAATADLTNYDDPTEYAVVTTECFEVADTTTASTAQTWLPNDSATITSAGDSNLDGSVRFQLYSDGECGADGGSLLYQEDVDIPAGTASPTTVFTTNGDGDTTAPDADVVFDVSDSPVTVSWRAVFTSDDAGVGGSTANCETSTGLTMDDDNEPAP